MNESIIEDTDFALDILCSPFTPTQSLIHSGQEGGRKEKQGRDEIDEGSTVMVEK